MITEIEYLEFLLSNRIHPEYSLKEIREEIAFKSGIKETSFKHALIDMIDVGILSNVVRGCYNVLNNKVRGRING